VPRSSSEPQVSEILVRGLDQKTKDEFKNSLLHSALIDRVVEVLKGWKSEVLTISRDDYESPAWACKQADRNGELRTLNKLIKLLDLKDQNG